MNVNLFGDLILSFITITLFSILIGFSFGSFHCLILKKLRYLTEKPLFEVCITIFFGLITYLVTEKLE